MKNRSYYLFDDMVNIKGFDSINIKIDEKPYKNILINYIGYMIPNKVKPLYKNHKKTQKSMSFNNVAVITVKKTEKST